MDVQVTLVQCVLIGTYPGNFTTEVEAFYIKHCGGIQGMTVQNMAGCVLA